MDEGKANDNGNEWRTKRVKQRRNNFCILLLLVHKSFLTIPHPTQRPVHDILPKERMIMSNKKSILNNIPHLITFGL